ncbi:hypothetical protein D9619_000639 [Psilocybe cf. subviscida]|uniref:CCD97-like C-terminal domain-containing protein n=1 Tax=Psilocybe cf. subviscida TaxID=2480587 RepID=A0A8H5F2X3_9AGAR|nr:hypothetical protein D9619_000639 [Psilocybe cf. subviscida]
MLSPPFDKKPSLKYLGLPEEYTPAPDSDPIAFLAKHLTQLPPHLLIHYSTITAPKQRSVIAAIRNRRLKYANKNPPELSFEAGRNTWPELWQGKTERRGVKEGKEEREWTDGGFLPGSKQLVGKLGGLLAEYEEEREAERMRALRRSRPPVDDFVPEEDTDSEDEDEVEVVQQTVPDPPETEEEAKAAFERLLRERFIYGLLDNIDYDKCDWDETLGDEEDRDAEERWFDDDDDME